MRFRALSLVAGVAVLALTAGGALASSDAVDQHQDGAATSWDAGDNGTAQTFTPAVSGHLGRVSLWGLDSLGGTITGVDLLSGGPTGTLLATSSAATPISGAWFDAAFSPTVQVNAGSLYAIVLHTSGGVRIGGTCVAGTYTRGEALGLRGGVWQTIPSVPAFGSCITDFAFEEWVTAGATASPPTVAMAFGAASIPVGGTTSLTFTITNPNTVPTPEVRPALPSPGTLTNIGFTDTLPAGLSIATPNNIGGSCGGVITATAGTNLVSITGLSLAAGATCGFGINITGIAAGAKANSTSAITSAEGGTGDPATASITVAALLPAPTPSPIVTAPPTSAADSRGPGSDSLPLPFLALTAAAALAATRFVLRSESRVGRR